MRVTVAPSPTSQSTRLVSGPMVAPESTTVARRMCVFGRTVTSGASVAVTSIQVVAGSRIVAPSSCHRRTVRALRILAASASCTLSLTPRAAAASGAVETPPSAGVASRSSATTSVRYFSPCALAVPTRARCVRSGGRAEDVDARVDLGDGCLVLRRILLLDDALHGRRPASRMMRP